MDSAGRVEFLLKEIQKDLKVRGGNADVQPITIVMGESSVSTGVLMTNRCPSAETSYSGLNG